MMRSVSSLFDLSGRAALITGGAGHLGRAMGEALAECGARVALLDRESPNAAGAALPDVDSGSHFALQLDLSNEAAVQAALGGLMQGKTVIAIAHRLSTIQRMDRIVVIDEGRVVEKGSHDALLAAGGLYARLWARQSGGFLVVDAAE